MISRKVRLRFSVWALMITGVVVGWYSYFEPSSFLAIGVGTVLGAANTLIRGYTATNLAILFGLMTLSGLFAGFYAFLITGEFIWAIVYFLISFAAGMRTRQYWRFRPWKLENSDW